MLMIILPEVKKYPVRWIIYIYIIKIQTSPLTSLVTNNTHQGFSSEKYIYTGTGNTTQRTSSSTTIIDYEEKIMGDILNFDNHRKMIIILVPVLLLLIIKYIKYINNST
jgi:hypothetical protein